MKILKTLMLGFVGLIVVLATVGMLLPSKVHIERSTTVAAKPATVFVYLNGFKNFNKWSPWAALDPKTQYTFEGPLVGVGAKESWASEQAGVGNGSQEITAVKANQSITIKLLLPDMQPSVVTQTLTPEGDGTKIVWGIDANMGSNPMNRWFGLILDKLMGPDYEKGLAQMKPLIEALPKDDLAASGVSLAITTAKPLLVISDSASAAGDGAEVGAKLGAAYQKIGAWMTANGYTLADAPMAITRKFDDKTLFWDFDAAIVVDKAGAAPAADAGIKVVSSYAGPALKITHTGPYTAMQTSYAKLLAYKAVAGFQDNGNSWEHYVTDPGNTPPDQLKTEIYWPVK